MGDLVEKSCQHCGVYFTSKRADKKYCSDTCRQMAYFKRNGFSVVTEQLVEQQVQEKCTQDPVVKYVSHPSGQHLETLFGQLSDLMEQRIAGLKHDLKEEFGMKYNNETSFTGSVLESRDSASVSGEAYFQPMRPRLQWYIEGELDRDNHLYKLEQPSKYWNQDGIVIIKWVNLRLRCLLESLIRLSNYAYIDNHTLTCMRDALNRLGASKTYGLLPSGYPLKQLYEELMLQFQSYTMKSRKAEHVTFCIPLKQKAKMIYARLILKRVTPSVKFSELNFEE